MISFVRVKGVNFLHVNGFIAVGVAAKREKDNIHIADSLYTTDLDPLLTLRCDGSRRRMIDTLSPFQVFGLGTPTSRRFKFRVVHGGVVSRLPDLFLNFINRVPYHEDPYTRK